MTSKKTVVRAVVSAFGAAQWTEAQAKSAVRELRFFATRLLKGKLGDVSKRLRENLGCIRVEVKELSKSLENGGWNEVRGIVAFIRATAADLEKKTYRSKLITRFRSRLYR